MLVAVAYGCAMVGHEFNDKKVDLLKPEISTVDGEIDLFGQPIAESTYEDDHPLLQRQYL